MCARVRAHKRACMLQEKEARRKAATDDKIARRRERAIPADDYDALFVEDAEPVEGAGDEVGEGVAEVGGGLGTEIGKAVDLDVMREGREGSVAQDGGGRKMEARVDGRKRRALAGTGMDGAEGRGSGAEGAHEVELTGGVTERAPANVGLFKSRWEAV